jgi:hypothetical protein
VNVLMKQFADLLQKELEHLKTVRREIRLFSGECLGSFAGYTYYRFEIPEDKFFRTTERASFTFGQQQPITVVGNIIDIENQYLTVALPQNFGESVPEVLCSWNHEHELKPTIELLQKLNGQSLIPYLLFNPADTHNSHVVNYEIQRDLKTQPEHIDAVKKIWQNRVTMVWGPKYSQSTHVLILAAISYLKVGRKVLFVSPSNNYVDEVLLETVAAGERFGMKMTKVAARVDLPSPESFETIAPYSFEHQLETAKEEKRKAFQERISLVDSHWRIKVKQILNEDFYKKVQEKRDRLSDLRRQIDQVSKEKTQLNQTIADLEHATLMDRLKKGFSRKDLVAANDQLARQQQNYNRLVSIQQALSNEIMEIELDAPVTSKEQMQWKEIGKRIDELGGMEKISKEIENFLAQDESALLQSKLFIATGVNTALLDPAIRGQKFDLVLVQDAQRINLPTLAALASLAREKFVLAGNPFEVEPIPASKEGKPDPLLQRNIFMHVAQTTELRRLFEWSEKNPRWSILMKSQYVKTPKLSMLISSALFDSKINVFASLQAKSKIYFIDTSKIRSRCKQYSGKKINLPYNELHTKQVLECVKHALIEPGRHAHDVGVIVPFMGPTLHTKLQLRIQGIKNVEVGTPQSFCGRQKKVIIFDTTMAGVDYTMQSIDDKEVGLNAITRLLSSIASCVKEDLYVIADMSHFKFLYQDRLLTRILQLLQVEAEQQQPSFTDAVKKFDDLSQEEREELISLVSKKLRTPAPVKDPVVQKEKTDHNLEVQMKKMAREWESKLAANAGRNIEREVYTAVRRVLGWRADVNLVSQFVGGDLLFRNSFATEKASRKLPVDTCQNEIQFRNVMEQWNLLIYEMSGGNKADMSFFASKSPEGRVRQDIRNLHAYYSSDVEAAIEEGKKKIAVEVARVFQELLGKSKPDKPADWSTSYLNFLTRLEAYLSWISEQVRR